MAPGLVHEELLVDPHRFFPLALHGLLWDFPNIQSTQRGCFLELLRFLGIINLLDNIVKYLKVQCFSLWFQTRISLLSLTKISLVYHILSVTSLMSFSPTTSLSTSSKLLGGCNVLLVVDSSSSTSSRVSSWINIRIFQLYPHMACLVCYTRVMNWWSFSLFLYLATYYVTSYPI